MTRGAAGRAGVARALPSAVWRWSLPGDGGCCDTAAEDHAMPRLASLSRLPVPSRSSGLSRFSSLSLLSALGLFAWALLGLSACDKGPARECDSRFDCPAPFVCDGGATGFLIESNRAVSLFFLLGRFGICRL